MAFHTHIRLAKKGLPRTNTLAYSKFTDIKSFITLALVVIQQHEDKNVKKKIQKKFFDRNLVMIFKLGCIGRSIYPKLTLHSYDVWNRGRPKSLLNASAENSKSSETRSTTGFNIRVIGERS